MSKAQTALTEVQGVTDQATYSARNADSGEVVSLLKGNSTLAVWLVFLGLGGGLLALYYARIGYLPDIEWSSTLIYLAAASVIGGGVGILFALSLFVPGFIWEEFIVFDPSISGAFCYKDSRHGPCIRAIVHELGIPFGLVVFVSHVSLLAVFSGVVVRPTAMALLLAGIEASLLTLTAIWMRRKFEGLASSQPEHVVREASLSSVLSRPPDQQGITDNEERNRYVFKYTVWFVLSIFVSQISMLFFYLLSGKPREFDFWVTTIICTVGVLISNHIVAVHYRKGKGQAIAASLVIASLLLVAADQFSPLSLRVMGYFGFGGDRKFDLVVSHQGAMIMNQLGVSAECGTEKQEFSGDTPEILERVCGVEILSKVGAEYYLRQDQKVFTLPKETVLSRVLRVPAETKMPGEIHVD